MLALYRQLRTLEPELVIRRETPEPLLMMMACQWPVIRLEQGHVGIARWPSTRWWRTEQGSCRPSAPLSMARRASTPTWRPAGWLARPTGAPSRFVTHLLARVKDTPSHLRAQQPGLYGMCTFAGTGRQMVQANCL